MIVLPTSRRMFVKLLVFACLALVSRAEDQDMSSFLAHQRAESRDQATTPQSQGINLNQQQQSEVEKLLRSGAYRYEPGTAICDKGKCDTCAKGVPMDWGKDLTTCEYYDIAWDKHEEGGWLALCKHVGYFDPIVYTVGGIRYPNWDAYHGCCAIWHKRACPPKYVAHPEEVWGTMSRFIMDSKHRSLLAATN